MVDWLLKLVIIWLCFDIVILATWWYLKNVIRPHYPEWWRRVVVDEDSDFRV